MSDTVTNVLVVGIGGQGVLTATEVLAEAAMELGFDVKKTEVAGMAQRGGSVTSHLRFGGKVLAPAIAPGEADLMLAFEPAEALRWAPHLRPGATAVVNTLRAIPPVVSSGLFRYPDDPLASMRALPIRVLSLDASGIAREVADVRLTNTVMLGAVSDLLPLGADLLRRRVEARFARKPKLLPANLVAFDRGRQAAAELAAERAVA
ncbi:MAG TPA: indolepyruvate oxidoreductase subunit beta [Azospirillum sp.]